MKKILAFWMIILHAGNIESGLPKNKLDDYVLHYEPLAYDRKVFFYHNQRSDTARGLNFNFKSHGRLFDIVLHRDTSLFAQDLHVEDVTDFQPFNVYEGYMHNQPLSLVHGFVYDGIFEGRIHTEDGEEFHVESVKRYRHLDNNTIHSIIYNTKDVAQKELYKCGGVKAKRYNNESLGGEHLNVDNKDPFVTSTADNHRHRRAVPSDKKECQLYLRADPTYIEWANNDKIRSLYLITQHVKRVSQMYQDTDFTGDGSKDGYSLKIKRIGIIDTSKCSGSDNSVNCKYKPKYIGVEKFLDIASLENHNAYCLSYVFCHRDFSGGVLGLAWIGDPNGVGGICDKNIQINGVMKSLNTGIVSNLNYGKTVPSRVTDVTFAHEVGHNFGSQHDPTSGKCAPGSSTGNFVMYPRATSGTASNNKKFSTCSINFMWSVIKVRAPKCFGKQGDPICGNRVVEKGEECDCGYENEQSCKDDECCNGASLDGSNSRGCRYTSKAKGVTKKRCSPSNGICCDGTTCQPYDASANKVCDKSDDCAGQAICNSDSIKCPKPTAQQDGTKCNNGANTCKNGACTGSLCELQNKVSCQCNETASFCYVCCQDKYKKNKCDLYENNGDNVYRPPGSPCDNYEGYCDILFKCRKVDAEGPLSRLKKFISTQSIQSMLGWMKKYWWACILIGLGMVIVMVAFIALCSVHTPSSNPNKPQAKPLTLRRGRPSGSSDTAQPGLEMT